MSLALGCAPPEQISCRTIDSFGRPGMLAQSLLASREDKTLSRSLKLLCQHKINRYGIGMTSWVNPDGSGWGKN